MCSFPVHTLFLADVNYGEYSTDVTKTNSDWGDWLFDLMDESKYRFVFAPLSSVSPPILWTCLLIPSSPVVCDLNPCFNGGSCQTKSLTEFTCLCVEPYVGKRCQKGQKIHS